MDFVTILFGVAVIIFLFWLVNSVYVIKEWERGVVLRLGRMLPEAKGAGLQLVFFPIDKLTRISAAHRNTGRAAAGRDYPRQRLREGQRRMLLPRSRCQSRPVAGAELSICYFAVGADHAAQPDRTVRIGLHPFGARKG